MNTSPSFGQSVWLVTEREIGSKLRSKSFIISTVVMFLIVLAAVLLAGFTAQSDNRTPIAVTSETDSALTDPDAFDVTDAATADEARELVRDGEVDAAVIPGGAEPLGYTVVFDEQVSNSLLQQLSIAPEVEILEPASTDGFLRYIIAIAFGGVFFAAALTFGTTIATSVVEEKQTRVVELLISAIPTRALLAGKVLGNTVLAMGQIVGIAAVAIISRCLGLDLSWPQAGLLMVGLILGVMIPAAPGAAGTYEAGGVAALGILGFERTLSFSFILLLHSFQFVSILTLGIPVLIAEGFNPKEMMREAQAEAKK